MKKIVCCWILLALAVLLTGGCAATKHVDYSRSDIKPTPSGIQKQATLAVAPFVDKRKETSPHAPQFSVDRRADIGDKTWCLNVEKHYADDMVTVEVTRAIRQHLRAKGSFTKIVPTPEPADYILSGSVKTMLGQQESSTGARIGAHFGLIGALATMGLETPGTIEVLLSDLKLTDAQGRVVQEFDDARYLYEGSISVDADCLRIYDKTNLGLKGAVEQLARRLEQLTLAGR